MKYFGELFNRKLLFSLDQLVSRFLSLALFPADGRALGCSLRATALSFFARRRAVYGSFFGAAPFAETRLPTGLPF
jgi:hypothetical protein